MSLSSIQFDPNFDDRRSLSPTYWQNRHLSWNSITEDVLSMYAPTETSSPHGLLLPQVPPRVMARPSFSSSRSDLSGTATPRSIELKIPNLLFPSDYFENTFHKRYSRRDYCIKKISDHDDDAFLTPWQRKLQRISPFCTILALGAYITYFAFRVIYTLSAQRKYNKVYVMAWLFIASEALVAIPAFFHQGYSILAARGRNRPKLRIMGEVVPTVDIVITCCKEEVEVVIDTTRAAVAVDYPKDRFRVVVLDDGNDVELRRAVDILSLKHPNVYYFARKKIKGVPHHAKAGNLIAGTEFLTKVEGGEAEYIAALDADMIPEECWLRAIVAHLESDPKLALGCPPQLFYNIPDNDPLVQTLDAFVHVMETAKDATGVAWCTGSGYIIRRTALEAIGGFPTGTLAEDTFTSSMLLGSGWKTAYIHEPLQFGTVPESYVGHLKQRTRWTLGTLQSAWKQRFCLWGPITKHMTVLQRLSGIVFAIDAYFKVFLVVAIVTIPIVLVSGGTLVAYSNYNQLRWQIRLCFITVILTRITEYATYSASGFRLLQRDSAAMLWMAPYHAITIIRCFMLPSWLGGKKMAFSSSGSIKDELNERDARLRAPLHRRLRVIIWDCDAWMHVLFVLFVATAVILSTTRGFTMTDTWRKMLLYQLTHAWFPPTLWIVCLTAFWVPLRYAIWPPTMPDREDLLDRDEKTDVARPKEEWKKQRWRKSAWHETQFVLVTGWTTVAFFGSLFI